MSTNKNEMQKALKEICVIAYNKTTEINTRLNALKFLATFNQSELERKQKIKSEKGKKNPENWW